MSSADGNSPDVIGKVFLVRPHGLLECMVCGELFTRTAAPAHADVELLPGCGVLFARTNTRRKACH